ncbi:proteasome assembly chaperone family protein [Methanoplanus sp. FWC-SCC4]|uniref:Proteasome assembly chaperone family protein n=1 Tax=Methanochimaera problematica TaxID=2609417 RepID=A0AA97I2N4_9EURY|nr:proteasome assembly chaperone family protein [Methanoplanus sp. FWC-SCC4]WOF15793.1 proteasome assembly chaperone family protein [Methanoplanus sp. FWC-SCC4]
MDDIKIVSEMAGADEVIALVGFPGSGLVGSISIQYLVDNADFEFVGSITSKYFPPIAMMVDGVINAPIRIYRKDSFVAFVSDIPIHPTICYEVTNGIISWLKGFNLKEIVVVAGIVTNTPEKRVFGVASEQVHLEKIKDTEILPMGSISGMPGSILTECKASGIPAIGLLGETVNTPDPRSAVSILEVLNSLYKFGVEVEALSEQAEEIESSMQKMVEQVRETEKEQQHPKKEHLPMYG